MDKTSFCVKWLEPPPVPALVLAVFFHSNTLVSLRRLQLDHDRVGWVVVDWVVVGWDVQPTTTSHKHYYILF
jgi:hypothetical protein